LIQRCISNCSAFASHNQALTAGKLADALKLRSTETRAMASKEMPNAPALPGYAKTMVPDALTHIKQSDGWKLEDQLFGPDPAAVTPCKE